MLNFRFALAFELTFFYTISSKFAEVRFSYLVLTLIEDLRSSRKYQILVGLFGALTILNSFRMN